MRVGINGLGRIGRALFRANLQDQCFEPVVINDLNPDPQNLAYLLKYDSTYGRLNLNVQVENEELSVDGIKAPLYREEKITDVPWEDYGVDVIVDASGVKANAYAAMELKKRGIKHVILTNSPELEVPYKSVVMGVNEDNLRQEDFLVSSSICDANAVVPALYWLNQEFGVEHGFMTTLHPWLNYQNLLDGPSLSFSDPGHIHSTYVLGRSSINALIPKTTTLLSATRKVLPWVDEKFMCFSYRIPTSIVSSADLTLKLKGKVSSDDVIRLFQDVAANQSWEVIYNNNEALTSVDFTGFPFSCCIDQRWVMVQVDSYLKLVLWYDNEWAYSCRVADLICHIKSMYGFDG